MMLVAISLAGACKKDENGAGKGGVAINNENSAKGLFSKMNNLWKVTLRPTLAKTPQLYTNTILNGTSGTATVNGEYSTTRSSSSSSTRSSSTVDVTVTFKDFEADGLTINGTLRFFDYSNSRTACSSSGCASSNHTDLDYQSKNSSGGSLGPVSVQFEYSGQNYKDAVTMDINKYDNAHWAIIIINSAGETINTSY
ncbi:hypothetical protein GCM10023149_05320 [Mucilaginibacter gynuensis]|uniref:Lipoprotein n=2 Tax=Mucilaginibacter gynuensis TaxID=1302236 RepID=A0ABP8FTF8_9SPHI